MLLAFILLIPIGMSSAMAQDKYVTDTQIDDSGLIPDSDDIGAVAVVDELQEARDIMLDIMSGQLDTDGFRSSVSEDMALASAFDDIPIVMLGIDYKDGKKVLHVGIFDDAFYDNQSFLKETLYERFPGIEIHLAAADYITPLQTSQTATNDTLSPLKQMKMGIPIDEIQCNDNKILMQSPSGKPACLSESTVSKLADRGFSLVVLKENISIESNVEISKTVWNSKDFVNPNKDETFSAPQTHNAPFPSISTEIPSQVRIGEEFTVIVHLDFSPNVGRSFDPDYPHSEMGIGFPGQLELISTDVPIRSERISTLDWYNQTKFSYSLELPYTGEITYDVELVFRMNEPLFYGDEKLELVQTDGYHDHSKWYLSTTNDVLTISPQPLFASGSDDSKFPDRYKKPIYHGIKEPFTPGAGPTYDNLNSLPKDVQDGLQRFFQHNYNMTAPQSNPSTMSPEIKAQYQAWLESITPTSKVRGQNTPSQVFIHDQISFTDIAGVQTSS